MNNSSIFQNYCENAIKKLKNDDIEQFKLTKDDETRIKIIYNVAKTMEINYNDNGKDFNRAQEEKNLGNQYFVKKDYKNALNSYNNGIILCPQNTDETKELLTILISNRSAVFYELKEYKKVFNDIDYLLEIGSYPAHLEYKIWLRKGKCYLALQNEKSANESFNQALESLQKSKLTQEEINKKISEINSVRTSKFPVASHEIIPISNTNVFIGDNQYISAHPKVNFQQDDVQGRYAIAAEDIEAGTIILEENPHCSVISFEHQLTNCQYCATSTNQPISCPNCAYAIFCTTNCERISNDSFHKIECGFKRELQNAGVSINCCMALRIIAQKPLQFFKQKKKLLKDFFKDSTKKIQPKKKVYRYDDYDNVFFLCRNENSRNKEDLIHFSCMAVFLMRLLKIGEYFGDYQLLQPDGDDLNEDELLIATLILRHLEILQFNAHELSELRNIGKRDRKVVHELDTFYETEAIGAAIYPTLALFNHSCDPSIIRYNVKNRMIARTIKPIKSGEIIYENYGPLYMSMAIEKRQELLLKKYLFECLCVPCVELWPLFNEMNENELRIPCNSTKCPFVFVIYGNEEPFLTCNYCHQVTSILPHLKGLMSLREILEEAEATFVNGEFECALKIFLKALNILFKYTKPPHPDIIKVQQRIRVCMVHFGNKSVDYKSNL